MTLHSNHYAGTLSKDAFLKIHGEPIMGQKHGTIRAQIAGHGQYETTFQAFDAMLELYWDKPLSELYRLLKERQGDPGYDTTDLTRTEAIMILQELEGHATN